MALEFMFKPDVSNLPYELSLPDQFMDYAYNGHEFVYLTNSNRQRYKVGFVVKRDGTAVLQGKRFYDFAVDVIKPTVYMLHFVQEGDDSFYVTGYMNSGTEMCGYDNVEGRMARCLVWVFDDRKLHQAVPAVFLAGLNVRDSVVIDVENEHYNVRVRRVEDGYAGSNVFEYQFKKKHWNAIVKNHGMIGGMKVVLTQKEINRFQLMLFDEDGVQISTGVCLGVTTLVADQPKLSFVEKDDDRLIHVCEWEYHKDHFGEADKSAFFKWFPLITSDNRLKLPASFLKSYPMHMYGKCFIRHQKIEFEMRIKMEYHREDPDRVNNVGMYGKWREFRDACGFDNKKMLRFKFKYTVAILDDDDEGPFPVFEVC